MPPQPRIISHRKMTIAAAEMRIDQSTAYLLSDRGLIDRPDWWASISHHQINRCDRP
jgi:hypothetical protein